MTLYANAGPTPFSLTCDTSLNQEIKWIQSFNRTTFYYVKPSSKYQVSTDGTVLTIINVSLNDEEYFACGYKVNKTFKIIKSYLLYVRGTLYLSVLQKISALQLSKILKNILNQVNMQNYLKKYLIKAKTEHLICKKSRASALAFILLSLYFKKFNHLWQYFSTIN